MAENNIRFNSSVLVDGPSRAPARAMLKAVGYTDEDLAKPLVGVAHTWIEIMPCTFHLRQLAEQVKKGIPVDGATFEDAQPVLHAVTENVLLEIQKTFDFFKASASTEQIDRIMLSGGASRVDGFREMVQERFNAPVEDFDPFRAVTWDARKLGGEPAEMASSAAVAIGLALRKVTDR